MHDLFFRRWRKSALGGMPLMFNIEGICDCGVDGFELQHFVDCVLHTMDLGISQRMVASGFLALIRANVYNSNGRSLLAKMNSGMVLLKRDARTYYKNFDAHSLTKATRMKNWGLSKLGKLDTPCLKAKGAQTKHLVKFVVSMLEQHIHKLPARTRLLLTAARALDEYYDMLRSEHRYMSLEARARLMDLNITMVEAWRHYGGHMVTKHHNMFHLTQSSNGAGNPQYVATYQDESDNGVVARLGEHLHAITWYISLWERLEIHDAISLPAELEAELE